MTQSVLITGCSSGIGLCTAELLKSHGYQVFATARKLQDVQALQQQGFESLQLDVNDSSSIQAAVAELLRRTGGTLFALINNAGYGQPGALEDLSRDLLRQQFETNVLGVQELTNCIVPVLRAQGYGRIIYLSSLLGHVALPYRGAYNASKFAVEGLANTLRLELRGLPIYVSTIVPGPIKSEFRDNALTQFVNHLENKPSVHTATYHHMLKRFTDNRQPEPFELPPEAVAQKILRALQSRRPKTHYYVTFPAHLLTFLKRLLPTRALDWVLWQISKKETSGR
jgi:short-subunit dehydrogenase